VVAIETETEIGTGTETEIKVAVEAAIVAAVAIRTEGEKERKTGIGEETETETGTGKGIAVGTRAGRKIEAGTGTETETEVVVIAHVQGRRQTLKRALTYNGSDLIMYSYIHAFTCDHALAAVFALNHSLDRYIVIEIQLLSCCFNRGEVTYYARLLDCKQNFIIGRNIRTSL
jgi:hypothetical protein